MSVLTLPRRGLMELPRAPVELQEAVELYARKSGRHGTLHIVPFGGWFLALTLRPDDKRLERYKQGLSADEPHEKVWFHVKNPFEHKIVDVRKDKRFKNMPLMPWCHGVRRQGQFLQLDIRQMGVEGVTEFLEADNVWSGRGKFRSFTESWQKIEEANRVGLERLREQMAEKAGKRARDLRRQLLRIPYLSVLIDLKGSEKNGQEKA